MINETYEEDELVCRKRAAKLVGFTAGTLAVWDCTKRYNLKPIKFGRSVRYSRSHLKEIQESGLLPKRH